MLNNELEEQIKHITGKSIHSVRAVSGGDINQAAILVFNDQSRLFLKYNAHTNRDMFEKEAKGLDLLKRQQTSMYIPEVINYGYLEASHTGYLLMELIQTGQENTNFFTYFGHALAEMHKVTTGFYGLDYDNYIGRLPQSNHKHDNWIDFFISERIEPQYKMAFDSHRLPESGAVYLQHLYSKLPEILPDEPPSLLHGDLWSGNYLCGQNQQIILIDPAVYFGHREMEIAFTQLFGGFGANFYQAYQESFPQEPNFSSRKDIYNLYPLLVHTNLFGGSYANSVMHILSRFR